MNIIFKSIWNQATKTYVATSELAKSGGAIAIGGLLRKYKRLLSSLITIALLTLPCSISFAGTILPTGGVVTVGQSTISSNSTSMLINQSSNKSAINWQNFSIGLGNSVNITQPSANSILLNRVIGSDPSNIYGTLNANGQVFLINPTGILFAPSASVNVGGLVASTLSITDNDFSAGKYSFNSTNSLGALQNQGNLSADNGYVALLSSKVTNQGTISARLGSVAMAAGNAITLDLMGNGLINVTVDKGTVNALIQNGGLIKVDGGNVLLTTQAAGQLLNTVVNNTGVIQAQTISTSNGTIKLLADMQSGTTNVNGTLDASAPNGGNGGNIETSGANVSIVNNAVVTTLATQGKTGNWLIDPTDYSVGPIGGNQTGTQLANSLSTTSVTIQSSLGTSSVTGDTLNTGGNININASLTWTANTNLTLTASNNVNINAKITASGNTAGLALNPNTANGGVSASGTGSLNISTGNSITLSGTAPSLSISGVNYTIINSFGTPTSSNDGTFQGINGNLNGHYALGSNQNIGLTLDNLYAYQPIGSNTTPFNGIFEGLGNTIKDYNISLSTNYVGLFGVIGSSGVVRDINLNATTDKTFGMQGLNFVGGIAGKNLGSIINSSAQNILVNYYSLTSGNAQEIGGLVGYNAGNIKNSYTYNNVVTGNAAIGGLVGFNSGSTSTISNSFATNNAITGSAIGSTNSFDIGGLVGENTGIIINSYSGGIYGSSNSNTNVNGYNLVGGLVGYNLGGTITNSFSSAVVTGTTNTGGLVGLNSVTATSSYWDTTTSTKSSSSTGTGLNTTNMQLQASFTGWDFGNTWVMYAGYTYPMLRALMTPLTVSAPAVTSTYSGNYYAYFPANNTGFTSVDTSGNIITDGVNYSLSVINLTNLYSNPIFGGTFLTAKNAGSYTITPSGMISNQLGYILNYTSGSLTINPATLTVTGETASNKVYDATTTATLSGGTLSGLIAGDSVTLSQNGTFASKNVGTSIVVTSADTISGSSASNYILTQPTGLTASITAASLSVTGETASNKVYDATTTATLSGGTLSGVISGDAVTLISSGTFSSKNVNSGITVTATDTLGGTSASNYTLIQTSGLTANITPASLTVTGETASNKVYDSTTTATINTGSATLSGVYSGDTVSLSTSNVAGSFADKNVESSKAVTVTGNTISGTSATNYTLTQPTGLTANITPATITVTGETATNKIYDSTTVATINTGIAAISGVISGDTVTLVTANATGAFSNINVGNGKSVTVSGNSISGTSASNYSLLQPTGLTANVTAATLTVTGETASNKTYDSTTTATLTGGSLSGVFNGDTVALTQAGTFASKNVGTGIVVTAADVISGTSASNYTLTQPTGLTANITTATLTVTGETASNKTYDGATTASINTASAVLSGVYSGDTVNLATANIAGTFSDKNVGTAKTVAVIGNSISGSDSGNYQLVQPTSLTANITPASLSVIATSTYKVYGNADPTLSYSISGLIGVESANSNLSGLVSRISGESGGSYVINQGSLLSSSNYTIAFTQGTFQIIPGVLSGSSFSFPFNSIASNSPNVVPTTVIQPPPAVISPIINSMPSIPTIMATKNTNKPSIASLQIAPSINPNWDKVIVVGVGIRMPEVGEE